MLCSRPSGCSQGLSRRQACSSLSRRQGRASFLGFTQSKELSRVIAFGKKSKKKGGGGGGSAATTEAPADEAVVASSGDGELDVTNAIKACKDKMSKVRTWHCGERLLRLRSVSIANNAQKTKHEKKDEMRLTSYLPSHLNLRRSPTCRATSTACGRDAQIQRCWTTSKSSTTDQWRRSIPSRASPCQKHRRSS